MATDVQEDKVYTDELRNMCEYTCQICGKHMNAYYLRKHVRVSFHMDVDRAGSREKIR